MKLTRDEREIIISKTDAEDVWNVHTDSRSAFSSRLKKVAAALGVAVERQGFGYTFSLPLKSLSVRVPRRASEAQRAVSRAGVAAMQKSPRQPRQTGQSRPSGEGSGA